MIIVLLVAFVVLRNCFDYPLPFDEMATGLQNVGQLTLEDGWEQHRAFRLESAHEFQAYRVATNPFGGKCYRRAHTHTERKGKGARGGSGFDEQRTALFVAEGILRSRLSPETFITPRRLLGITNVFDENDVDVPAITFPREPARRFAESGIHMDKEAIRGSSLGGLRHLSASFC